MTLCPTVKSEVLNLAIPSLISAVWFTPSILIVTLPVAFVIISPAASLIVIFMYSVSQTVMSCTSTSNSVPIWNTSKSVVTVSSE